MILPTVIYTIISEATNKHCAACKTTIYIVCSRRLLRVASRYTVRMFVIMMIMMMMIISTHIYEFIYVNLLHFALRHPIMMACGIHLKNISAGKLMWDYLLMR